MRIETLKEFIEFSKCLNFTTAAKKLHISQPALSNHILDLENELGVELVCRGHNRELTAAGKAFFEGCCDVVASYENIAARVRELSSSQTKGTITIKDPLDGNIGSSPLIQIIGKFKQAHPSINVNLVSSTVRDVFDELSTGRIDCAALFNDTQNPTNPYLEHAIKLIPYSKGSVVLGMRNDHPLANKDILEFKDLAEYPYAMPAGAQFREFEVSVRYLYVMNGLILKNCHYKAVDTFNDYLFSAIGKDEIFLIDPETLVPNDIALRVFTPGLSQIMYVGFCENNVSPALELFLEFLTEFTDKHQN
ncbi:MAG: LysR family transcriptional regulator [Actinobacteria bacterium]|nr:LysR family transcriptional regulator [Actinomycetota bacterium]